MPKSGNSPADDLNPYATPKGVSLAENSQFALGPHPWGDFFAWILWALPAGFVLGYFAAYFAAVRRFSVSQMSAMTLLAVAVAGFFYLRKSYSYSAVPLLVLGYLGILAFFLLGASFGLQNL